MTYNFVVLRWWVWVLGFLFTTASLLGQPASSIKVNDEIRAVLTRDYQLDVFVQPHSGDAWTRLAKRVTGDAARWEEIAQFNHASDDLKTEKAVRIPFALLRFPLQRDILTHLFPDDRRTDSGWMHMVVGGHGIEGEPLWNIAEWFTGDGANYAAVRKANPGQGLSTRTGDHILVPNTLLTTAFGSETEGENAPKTAAEVRKPKDNPAQRSSADEDVPAASLSPSLAVPPLTYERNAAEPYAVYRLQKGEALYSSVAIRFTGRVYSKDVGDVVERIVKFNSIEDVARIPTGHAIRIPISLLLPQYRPQDDPTRLAEEASQRASAKLARRTRARNLTGVHVILDAGHGGVDPGATYDDVAEARYVYDVMCRLRKILDTKSAAKVSVTRNEGQVLTKPPYQLDDAIVGVNLRWYLANSIFRHAIKAGVAKEKVVFISVHADMLHPSLRGAMAYIPGGRYVQGRYEKRGAVYAARAEVRERPVVRHSERESLEAEGLSRDLAEDVIGAFEDAHLQVHPFNPVRDYVMRDGGEWVPAIIRYNVVPTRLLLEVCNLGNRRDRELMKTKKFRQRVAEAMYRGLVEFYTEDDNRSQIADRRSR
ncbi:MAG TPA: N-acetylmuramoyl-L-alanine amidase [Thermoanaerobaculia bacterium]